MKKVMVTKKHYGVEQEVSVQFDRVKGTGTVSLFIRGRYEGAKGWSTVARGLTADQCWKLSDAFNRLADEIVEAKFAKARGER